MASISAGDPLPAEIRASKKLHCSGIPNSFHSLRRHYTLVLSQGWVKGNNTNNDKNRIDVIVTIILIVIFVAIIVGIATTLVIFICLTIIIVVIVAIVLILIIGLPSSSRPAPRAEISDLALQRIPQLKKARLYIIIMVMVAMTTIIATAVIKIF